MTKLNSHVCIYISMYMIIFLTFFWLSDNVEDQQELSTKFCQNN